MYFPLRGTCPGWARLGWGFIFFTKIMLFSKDWLGFYIFMKINVVFQTSDYFLFIILGYATTTVFWAGAKLSGITINNISHSLSNYAAINMSKWHTSYAFIYFVFKYQNREFYKTLQSLNPFWIWMNLHVRNKSLGTCPVTVKFSWWWLYSPLELDYYT